MTESDDAQLLRTWLQSQSEAAFQSFVTRYAGLVHRAAMRTAGDDSLASEAFQLTFITLARKAKSLTSRESLAGWLHLTAVMHAKNLRRQHARETRKRQHLLTHMDRSSPDPSMDSWQQMQPVVDDALASLSAMDRETLLLRFYRSFSVREIATTLGIATDAAQKRLDRATARLRRQLVRRGCTVGGSLGVAALAGFSADAQAAVPGLSAPIAKLLSASAAGTSFTTISILLMTKKTTIAASAVLLVLGGAIVTILQSKPEASRVTADSPQGGGKSILSPSNTPASEPANTRSSRLREPSQHSDLVEKFGESRTRHSERVSRQILQLMNDYTSVAELNLAGNQGRITARNWERKQARLFDELLGMTEDQKRTAMALLEERAKRQIAGVRQRLAESEKNPRTIMESILADDALARGQMLREEYDHLGKSFSDVQFLLLSDLNLEGFKPDVWNDPELRAELERTLEPSQIDALREGLARFPVQDKKPLTPLPALDLEKLETTLAASQQAAKGMVMMLEGNNSIHEMRSDETTTDKAGGRQE